MTKTNGVVTVRYRRGAAACLVGLIAIVTLSGCSATSAYTTRAYPTVNKPSSASESYADWGSYYTDQFAVNGYKTDPPPASAPDAQKKAYNDAKLNWDQYMSTITKAERNQTNAWLIYGAVSLGATMLILLAL